MKALGFYLALIFSWVNAVPVEEDKPAEPQARFLSPLALEGIGRIFKLQSELVSCYRCSMDYPQHASACCIQGYPNCCSVSNLALPGNGYSTGNSYGHSLSFGGLSFVKDGLCPVSSPVSQLSLHSCTNQCDSDVQCIGDFKCCLYGCTRLCAKPQLGSLGSSVGFEKSGYCPPNSAMIFPSDSDVVVTANSYNLNSGWNNYDNYAPWNYAYSDDNFQPQYCGTDSDCPGSYKCCLRQYRRTCVTPSYSYYDQSYGRK